MRLYILTLLSFSLFGCLSSVPKKTVNNDLILGSTSGSKPLKANQIKESLTLSENQFQAGYGADAHLITDAWIEADEKEKGVTNMLSSQEIQKQIEKSKSLYKTQSQTCFVFQLHTMDVNRGMFKYWVAKLKDQKDEFHNIEFQNKTGVESVPEVYKDTWGRMSHNISLGCTQKKIPFEGSFTVYLIPQIKNNSDQNETTEFIWTFK